MTHDELKYINKERAKISFTSVLALAVLTIALFKASPQTILIVSIVIVIPLVKAAAQFRKLGKRRAELMSDYRPDS